MCNVSSGNKAQDTRRLKCEQLSSSCVSDLLLQLRGTQTLLDSSRLQCFRKKHLHETWTRDPSLVTLTLRLCALQGAVQVKLELGHRAQVRKKPTVEGFTHDWMVFVRGPEHSNIQHFVEKVVFHLHESFPKPKRGEESCPGALCGGGGLRAPHL